MNIRILYTILGQKAFYRSGIAFDSVLLLSINLGMVSRKYFILSGLGKLGVLMNHLIAYHYI